MTGNTTSVTRWGKSHYNFGSDYTLCEQSRQVLVQILAQENDRNTWGFTLRAESDSDLNLRKLKFRISRNKCSCHFCLEIVKKDLKRLFWRFKRLVDRKGMTDRKITLSFWNTCYKVRCDKRADQMRTGEPVFYPRIA